MFFALVALSSCGLEAAVKLPTVPTAEGFIAHLLVNEVPFPGERSYRSVADSKAAMESILNVLDARLRDVPSPYLQRHVAAVTTDDIIDIIAAGGVRGQVDGFYRADNGLPAVVPRVTERTAYLERIANDGAPGKFAQLLSHATVTASAYVAWVTTPRDRFASLTVIRGTAVTGRAYSWMTNANHFNPGGNFIRIYDEYGGGLGGNRFFTLRRYPK